MRHLLLLLLVMLSVCACAGNPPDWWNPGGTYGNTPSAKAVSQPTTGAAVAHTPKAEEEIPTEEKIDTTFEEYEELNLSDTGEVKSTTAAQTELTSADATEQADPMYAAEEHLPDDGSLPDPTVLE